MEITPIGYILIPLGLLLFLFYPRGLYVLTIFFIPFSATSVLNSGSGDAGSGIQPFLLFGFLLISRNCYAVLLGGRFRLDRRMRTAFLYYLLFLVICGASMFMPILINGKINVPSNGSLTATLDPLVFSLGRVRAYLGLILVAMVAFSIAQRNTGIEQFYNSVRIYLVSGAFICLWGILQAILFLINIPYPYMIFNNSASPNAGGYDAILDNVALRRVSSVSLEPSTLAITLISMLPLVVIPLVAKTPLFGKTRDYILCGLLLLTLILSTSSTGYVGFAVLCLLLPFGVAGLHRARGRIMAALALFAIVGGLAFAAFPTFREFLQVILIDKATSYSALERWTMVVIDYQYFLQYPILGIGWTSPPTHDTIASLLASCGVLGLGSFSLLVGYLLRKLWLDARSTTAEPAIKNIAVSMFMSLSGTLAAYLVGSLAVGGTFCIVVALCTAAVAINSAPGTAKRRRWRFLAAIPRAKPPAMAGGLAGGNRTE